MPAWLVAEGHVPGDLRGKIGLYVAALGLVCAGIGAIGAIVAVVVTTIAGDPKFAVLDGAPVTLKGISGQPVHFGLAGRASVHGRWAAPAGLTLALSRSDGRGEDTIQLAAPSAPGWSITLYRGSPTNEEFVVWTSFPAPVPAVGADGRFTGRIWGSLAWPREELGASGYVVAYRTEQADVSVPVELHVRPMLQPFDRRQGGVLFFVPLFLVGIVLSIVGGKLASGPGARS